MARDEGHIEDVSRTDVTKTFTGTDILNQLEVHPSFDSSGYRNSANVAYTGTTGIGSGNNTLTETAGEEGDSTDYLFQWKDDGTYQLVIDQAVEAQILIVGGGGGGGNGIDFNWDEGCGGGGGGGVVHAQTMTLAAGTYPVVIGAGGALNTNGGDSTFNSLIAKGGGAGASGTTNGYSSTGSFSLGVGWAGGSGGGGRGAGGDKSGGTSNQNLYGSTNGVTGYGNNGGTGTWQNGGGGGGGAGGGGGIGTNNSKGAMGAGIDLSITGTNVIYAQGGQGGADHEAGSTAGAASTTIGGGGGGCGRTSAGSHGIGTVGKDGAVIIRFNKISSAGAPLNCSMRSLHVDHYDYALGINQSNPGTVAPASNGHASKFSGSDVFGVKLKVQNETTNPSYYHVDDNGALELEMLGGSGGPGWKVGIINVSNEDDAFMSTDYGNPDHSFNMSTYEFIALTDTENKCIIDDLGGSGTSTVGSVIRVKIFDAAARDDENWFFFYFDVNIGNGSSGASVIFYDKSNNPSDSYTFTGQSQDALSNSIEAWYPGNNNSFNRVIVS